MSRKLKFLMLIIVTGFSLVSCNYYKNLNSNQMFKIPKDGSFQFDSLQMQPSEDYRIGPGDRFTFYISTNNGERIVNGLSGVNTAGSQGNSQSNLQSMDYLVRRNGKAELPIIGEYYVSGLTVVQLEDSITRILSNQFQNPFVQIRLTNQRVIVFPGKGAAQVIILPNVNTSLLEVIALAGGIGQDGFANSIKVMRKTKSAKREVYSIDLSSIDGLKQAEMIVQSNDYIYIDYKPKVARGVLTEMAPWISLFTSSLYMFILLTRI